VTTRSTTLNGIALGRTHARRLRDVYRSPGWPCLDSVEVELLAAGLLQRVVESSGQCWYVLGCDRKGKPIAEADEVPIECGVDGAGQGHAPARQQGSRNGRA
jgi:hypothetical protein